MRSTRTGRAAIVLGALLIGMALAWQPTPRSAYTASEMVLPCPRGTVASWGGNGTVVCESISEFADTSWASFWMEGDTIYAQWFCWEPEDGSLTWGMADSVLGHFTELVGPDLAVCDTVVFAPRPEILRLFAAPAYPTRKGGDRRGAPRTSHDSETEPSTPPER